MSADPVAIGWVPRVDTLGARLALVRQHMGWGNVKEAAESCGVPVQSWRTWERDGGIPRDILRLAKRVSAVTGVNYYWLLDGEAVPMTAPIQYEGPARRTTRGRSKAMDSAMADARARRDSNPQPSDP